MATAFNEPMVRWDHQTDPRATAAEVWTDAYYAPGRYMISNLGRVCSMNLRNRGVQLLQMSRTSAGYSALTLFAADGTQKGCLLHSLVITSFDGPPEPSWLEVRHLDTDPTNNRLSNLAYGTRQQNMEDVARARQEGRSRAARTLDPQKMWTWYDVPDDRYLQAGLDLYGAGKLSLQDLAFLWGTTSMVAQTVLTGQAFAYLRRPEPRSAARRPEDVRATIEAMVRDGANAAEISRTIGETITPQRVNYYRTKLGVVTEPGRPRGEVHGSTALTDVQMQGVIADIAAGRYRTAKEVGEVLQLSRTPLWDFLNGRSWPHLPRPTAFVAAVAQMKQRRKQLTQLALLAERVSTDTKRKRRLVHDDDPVVTRDELLQAVQTFGPERVEQELLPVVQEFLTSHVAAYGWFYPTTDMSVAGALEALRADTSETTERLPGTSRLANDFLRARFRSYWNVQGGPVEAFSQPHKLREVLKYRMGLNNSKMYRYPLVGGGLVEAHETFDITLASVRRGFLSRRYGVSFFKPRVAYLLMRRWVSGTVPVMWDPSSGFGARLLGFAAAFPQGRYIGNETAKQTFQDLQQLAEDLPCHVQLSRGGSEFAEIEANSLDFVLTSPPYFDLERYFDEPGQCWRDYPTVESWQSQYLEPTLTRASEGLKPGAHAVFSVNERWRSCLIDLASQCGLSLVHEHRLALGRDHFLKKSTSSATERSEPVLVFRRVTRSD